ncbi:uncharacterized protein LOC122069204 [Macadamia integrifolia]|uniref:uncharacterized protein LOC122069204 n=1 Tax=Macadamia integrifolia TaxID=60698 RepID=UPI001C4FDE6D|nr:uncharacterized protein LOC122069204 [Macadamia integrifolia]
MVDGLFVKNLSKLIDARLEFQQDLLFTTHGGTLCELLEDMDHARALTLSSWCLQALPIVDELDGLREILPSPVHNLRHLTLQTGLDNYGPVGLACLLRSSPNRETLSIDICNSIKMDWEYIDEPEYLDIFHLDGGKFGESQLLLFDCLTHHLKKVEINGFMGQNHEIGLIKFLVLPIRDGVDGLQQSLPSPLRYLKYLTVNTGLDNCGEFLDDAMDLDNFYFEGEKFWESQPLPFHCLHHHLWKIDLFGFEGQDHAIELVKYLLKNLIVLEEVVINYVEFKSSSHYECLEFLEEQMNNLQKLLAFQRASPCAEIIFS